MQVPPWSGQGPLVFCIFSRLLVVFLGIPAGFPTLPALFEGCALVTLFQSTETFLYNPNCAIADHCVWVLVVM